MNDDSKRIFFPAKTSARRLKTVLGRDVRNDREAFKECIRTHGSLVWSISKRFAATEADAEKLSIEIFEDIRHCAHRCEQSGLQETVFVALVARRRIYGR